MAHYKEDRRGLRQKLPVPCRVLLPGIRHRERKRRDRSEIEKVDDDSDKEIGYKVDLQLIWEKQLFNVDVFSVVASLFLRQRSREVATENESASAKSCDGYIKVKPGTWSLLCLITAGTVLGTLSPLSLVAKESGSKFVSQNIPKMQVDKTLTQSPSQTQRKNGHDVWRRCDVILTPRPESIKVLLSCAN